MARKAKKRKTVRAARPAKAAPARAVKRAAPRSGRVGSDEDIAKRKAVYDAAKDPWALPSFMAETNGGGSAEQVPGFDIFRAITSGFDSRRVAGPTTVLARPDGGFFSEGEIPSPSTVPPRGSPLAKPENVMGFDNRVMVTDTSTTPWRCICHLEVEYETGPVGFGTGFLIGPKAVITAAHVIYSGKRKARRIRVIPGRNGSSAPYGYFVTDFADCKVPDAWRKSAEKQEIDATADYAMIPIPDIYETEKKPTAERLGYFGLKCFTDDDARTKSEMLFVNNAGYPYEADKAYGTLWYNAGRVKEMKRSFIEYMVDTEGGQSGSPVYFYDDEKKQRYVIAIHTTGDFVNRGLRITQDVFKTIRRWAER
jgi:glutamyl endopeptidase